MFKHTEEMACKMWDTAQKLVLPDVKQILDGTPHKLKKVFAGRFISFVLRIEHPALRLQGRLMKAEKNCIKCGMCIKICPTKNISLKKDKLKFGGKCTLCTRCVMNCPINSIKLGLLNKWKINGKYKFKKPDYPEIDKHSNYCRKAYKRYFEEAEKRIKLYENKE